MTKSEILVVVKNMRQDWQRAIDGDTISIDKCDAGFCSWLISLKPRIATRCIMFELKKDLKFVNHKTEFWYWYRVYSNIGKQALIPRLNHLNRTITRLENELKTEQNGTL